MNKQKRKGKVIKCFTVEVVASNDSAMDINSSNPYTRLSDEERLKDLIDVFGLLWAETCREVSQKNSMNSIAEKYVYNEENI